MPGEASCNNTQKVPVTFQVSDAANLPAALDGEPTYTVAGSGSATPLATTVSPANGKPLYSFEAVSGATDVEDIQITVEGDGQPGSGLGTISDVFTLHVSPAAAVNF